MHQQVRISLFVDEIWKWFQVHRRVLPWRDLHIGDDSKRAYYILVSELMLQQTQVSRVTVKYPEFLQQFPTLFDLAGASNRDVILAWQGMGYNSRALRLRDCAKEIVAGYGLRDTRFNQKPATRNPIAFPQEMSDLISLPGVGHYTAAAIRNFAFNIPTPCIDTNIRRIYHRVFVGPENTEGDFEKDDTYLLTLADKVLEAALMHGNTADWHAALMDFGSLVQTKNKPKWDKCPLSYKGIMKATPINYPQSFKKKQTKKEPGRLIENKFVPNRIIRGRIVDRLRQNPFGLSPDDLGHNVCSDWCKQHEKWLQNILSSLSKDRIITLKRDKYALAG